MSPGNPSAEAQAQAGQVCTELAKLLGGLRTYSTGHPTLERFREGFEDRLREYLTTHGALELELGPLSLTVGGEAVWKVERKEQSITHQMFIQGVQRLTVSEGISEREVERLTQLWYRTMSGQLADDESFATGFWELDFANVECLNLDELAIFFGADQDEEAQASMVAVLGAMRKPTHQAVLQTGQQALMAQVAGLDPSGIVNVSEDGLARKDREADAQHLQLTASERRDALRHLAETPQQMLRRGVQAIFSARESADGDEEQWLHTHLRDALEQYVAGGHLVEALAIVSEANSADPDAPRWMAMNLGSAENLRIIAQGLQRNETQEAGFGLLELIGGAAAGRALLDALANIEDASIRERIGKMVAAAPPPLEAFAASVAAHDVRHFVRLLDVAKSPDSRFAVMAAGLEHEARGVRAAAVKRLHRRGAKRHRHRIYPMLTGSDPGLRKAGLNILMSIKDHEAVPAIRQCLESGNADDGERRRLIAALGSVGGAGAAAVLRSALETEGDGDLKIAIALALGRTGDQSSRGVLEEQAKRIFSSRKLKDACREAIRRLEFAEQHPEPEEEEEDEGALVEIDDEDDEWEDEEVDDPYTADAVLLDVYEIDVPDDESDDSLSIDVDLDIDDDDDEVEVSVDEDLDDLDDDPAGDFGADVDGDFDVDVDEDVDDEDTEDSVEAPLPVADPVGDDEDTEDEDTEESIEVPLPDKAVIESEPSDEDADDEDTEESVEVSQSVYRQVDVEPPDLDWGRTFSRYVIVREEGAVAIGAERDGVLTDLHRYPTQSVQTAYRSFLRDKVQTGFVPHLDRSRRLLSSERAEPFDPQVMLSYWGNDGEMVSHSDTEQSLSKPEAEAGGPMWLPPPSGPRAIDRTAVFGLGAPKGQTPKRTLTTEERRTIEHSVRVLTGGAAGDDPVASILVVDDRDFNRDLLARILRRGGHSVSQAKSGAEGLEKLMSTAYDLICLDINMPDMDGYEVAEIVRRQYSRFELPIIFVTARDDDEDILRGLQAGGNDYLTKPVDSAETLARVRTQLLMRLALQVADGVEVAWANATVVVADREKKNRDMIAAWLKGMNHRTIEATSGEDALRLVQQESVDLLLLDLAMPGSPGQETIEILRRYFSLVELPIIALSDGEQPRIATKALLAGANDVVAKPFALNVMGERLRWQLEMKAIFDALSRLETE